MADKHEWGLILMAEPRVQGSERSLGYAAPNLLLTLAAVAVIVLTFALLFEGLTLESSAIQTSRVSSLPFTDTRPVSTLPTGTTEIWANAGSGPALGARFTVPASASHWAEDWAYHCSSASGGTASGGHTTFVTPIIGYGQAALNTDVGAYQDHSRGSGESDYTGTGTFSIDVDSSCAWSITVLAYA
jgi:hypothetical protein